MQAKRMARIERPPRNTYISNKVSSINRVYSPDPDSRNPIKTVRQDKLSNYPFSVVFGLQIYFRSKWQTVGTCFAISKNSLMTAAHVFDDIVKYSKTGEIRLTHNAGGHLVASKFNLYNDALVSQHPSWNGNSLNEIYDVAVIEIPGAQFFDPLTIRSHTHGKWERLISKFPFLYIVGGGKNRNTARLAYGTYFSNFETKRYPDLLFYTANTSKSMSGSPIFIYNNGKYEVSGMHTTGRSGHPLIGKNYGLSLSQNSLSWLDNKGAQIS